jgi:hypothetical protein
MFSQIIPNFQHHPSNNPSKKITYGEVFLIIKQTIKSRGNHEEGSEEGIHKHLGSIYPYVGNIWNPMKPRNWGNSIMQQF